MNLDEFYTNEIVVEPGMVKFNHFFNLFLGKNGEMPN